MFLQLYHLYQGSYFKKITLKICILRYIVNINFKHVFGRYQVVGDDAVELDGGSGLVVLLGDLTTLFVDQERAWN